MESNVTLKLEKFFSTFKLIKYDKKEILIKAGDDIEEIFYIKRGEIRQYAITEDGNEITLHVFRPKSYFPIMLVLSETKNNYFFEASNSAEAYKAPVAAVLNFLEENPDVLLDLSKRLSSGIIGLLTRIEQLTSLNAYVKVVSVLLYSIKRFGEKIVDGNKTVIRIPLTHSELATWVGISRETASRQIEKLEKKGILFYAEHQLLIGDIEKLKAEL